MIEQRRHSRTTSTRGGTRRRRAEDACAKKLLISEPSLLVSWTPPLRREALRGLPICSDAVVASMASTTSRRASSRPAAPGHEAYAYAASPAPGTA